MPSLGKGIIRTLLGRSELDEFMQSSARNQWIKHKGYELYLRKAERPDGNWLELANVKRADGLGEHEERIAPHLDLGKPTNKGGRKQGRFKEVMEDLEAEAVTAGMHGVRVEQIHNEFLPKVLKRYGYEVGPEPGQLDNTPQAKLRLK